MLSIVALLLTSVGSGLLYWYNYPLHKWKGYIFWGPLLLRHGDGDLAEAQRRADAYGTTVQNLNKLGFALLFVGAVLQAVDLLIAAYNRGGF